MKTAISVIIVTKNRPEKLLNCIKSLSQNDFYPFEIIVIDQSKTISNINHVIKNNHYAFQFKHIHSKKIGKSKGLNEAISLSISPILAFTDDDCVVDKNWLQNIYKIFQKDKKIVGIFGRTLPYQPQKHKGLTCPCTFDHKIACHITKPCKHWEEIGFGNNMAWRKSFFDKYGKFKEWLGPGSIGNGAEDAEIALRALINKQTIFFNPKMLVKHDKWLTREAMHKQELSYACGEIACYGYLAKKNIDIGKKILKNNLINNYNQLIHLNKLTDLKEFLKKIYFQIKGFLIGFF